MDKPIKRIITYGTFDCFHYGHLRLLKGASDLGNYLMVGVSTDEFNYVKGKTSLFSFEERVDMLSHLSFIDLIIPECDWNQKSSDIVSNNIDVLVMGDDWKGKFDHLSEFCEVVYLPRTPKVSSTAIKKIYNEH